MSLTAAYSRYAVGKANEAVEAANGRLRSAQQEQKNALRAAPSMRSDGGGSDKGDAFLAAFDA